MAVPGEAPYPSQGSHPVEPQSRRGRERQQNDECSGRQGNVQTSPLTPCDEPQESDARRELGENRDRPERRPTEADHRNCGHEKVEITEDQLDADRLCSGQRARERSGKEGKQSDLSNGPHITNELQGRRPRSAIT